MPRNADDLMAAVASFLARDRSTFVKNGFDCLLQAANNARLYAERVIDFELSRVQAQVTGVSLVDGGSLDNATLLGTATPVSVKKIIRPFLTFPTTTATFPIAFYGRDRWLRRVQRAWENIRTANPSQWSNITIPQIQNWMTDYFSLNSQFSMVQVGRQFYLTPADEKAIGSTTFTAYFDVYKWLPDYGAATITGSATSTTSGKLVASAGSFITNLVRIGMVVRNTTNSTSAIVTAVDSATQLTLSSDIFTSGNAYAINVPTETDFLLQYCFDWLMYRTIWELNFFMKEDERVQLSTGLIADAWQAVRSWNENLIQQSTDDTDLS